jgi:hypothetical protein
MKQYTQEELRTKLLELRDLIFKYQEWAENNYIEKETKTDIYRAGLKELDEEIYFMMASNN